MAAILGFICITLTLKGLGGLFHPVAELFNGASVHYPAVALVIFLSFAAFVFSLRHIPLLPFNAPRPNLWVAAAVILSLLGLGARVTRINATPIDANQSDMVPNLIAGLEDVRQGVNPYQPHLLKHGGTISHFYPPTLWMPYVPLHLLGIDVRYLNVLAILLFYGLLCDLLLRIGNQNTKWLGSFLLLLGFHAFSKQAVHEVSILHTGPVWAYLSIFVWACLRKNVWWRDLGFVLLLLSRETASLFLFPFFVHLFLSNRQEAWRLTAKTLAGAAILVAPFVLLDAGGFFASILHYATLPNRDSAQAMLSLPGFLGFIKTWDLMFLQWPLRLIGCATALVVLVAKPHSPLPLRLGLCGLSYLVFVQFVSTAWPYTYAPLVQLCFFLYLTTSTVNSHRLPSE